MLCPGDQYFLCISFFSHLSDNRPPPSPFLNNLHVPGGHKGPLGLLSAAALGIQSQFLPLAATVLQLQHLPAVGPRRD